MSRKLIAAAQYVLFPDGSLHHDAVPGRGPNTLPAFTRRLDQTQLAELWSTVRTLGLADADGIDRIENFRRVNRPRSGHAYLIAVTGDGSYWNYTQAVPEGSTLDPALTSRCVNWPRCRGPRMHSTTSPHRTVRTISDPIRGRSIVRTRSSSMRCGVLITVMMSWLVGCSGAPTGTSR